MFKVVDRLILPNLHCISVEGDIKLLGKGIKLLDERGNSFIVESIGKTRYQNVEDYTKRAELVLCGDVENIGTILYLDE